MMDMITKYLTQSLVRKKHTWVFECICVTSTGCTIFGSIYLTSFPLSFPFMLHTTFRKPTQLSV